MNKKILITDGISADAKKKLEEHFDEELDIEFIIERDKAYITQINFVEEEDDEAEDYGEEAEGEDLEEVEEVEEEPQKEEDEEMDYYLDEAEKEVEGKEAKDDFEAELKELMSRYMDINPNLRKALGLLEKDILELYKRRK